MATGIKRIISESMYVFIFSEEEAIDLADDLKHRCISGESLHDIHKMLVKALAAKGKEKVVYV